MLLVVLEANFHLGKTIAFLLPAIEGLLKAPRQAQAGVSILILSPTRELALQVPSSAYPVFFIFLLFFFFFVCVIDREGGYDDLEAPPLQSATYHWWNQVRICASSQIVKLDRLLA